MVPAATIAAMVFTLVLCFAIPIGGLLLLRRRYKFAGDIRATGDVLIDQLVHMHRSGFSSAVLAESVDASAAQRQFERFAAFYQGDVLDPRPLFAREAA